MSTTSDPIALATGLYAHRGDDVDAKEQGQWGVSVRYRAASMNTEFRAYAMNVHSRAAFISVTNPNVNGTYGTFNPPRLTDPTANTQLAARRVVA